MGFFDKLAAAFKTSRPVAREVLKFYPPAAMAIKVADLVEKSKSGDQDAKERLVALKTLADTGDPKAQQAVTMAKGINQAHNEKASKPSLYDLGVTVGHDPEEFVGAVRGGFSWNYLTSSWYRTPPGQPDIPGPDGAAGQPSGGTDQRGTQTQAAQKRAIAASIAANRAKYEAARAAAAKRGMGSHYGVRFHGNQQAKFKDMAQLLAYRQAADLSAKSLGQRDKTRTEFDPSTSQDHEVTAWCLGLTQTVPPSVQQEYGVDPYGNPLPPPDYGYGPSPDYGYGPSPDYGYGAGEQFFDPYAGDGEVISNPSSMRYDPDTERFYSSCVRQAYDPETDSFAPVQEFNPYAFDEYDWGGVSGWALNVPYRSTASHVTQAAKSPGVALAARELYNRGIGQPATTRDTVVRKGLEGNPLLASVYGLARRLA